MNETDAGRRPAGGGNYLSLARAAGAMLLVLSVFFGGCTAALPRGQAIGPGTYKGSVNIRLNGFRRTYRVHVPSAYDPRKQFPLVVVVHGAFDTAAGIEKISGFSHLADREDFIALYPNGFGLFGFLQHWNAGHCCGKAAADQLDDVGFIARTIEDASRRLTVDRQRIYMVGFSNGGMMTYRFAAERGELLAAAAPLAASIAGRPSAEAPEWRIPKPAAPVSIVCLHGLADDDVPYAGGLSLHRGGTRSYASVDNSIGFWVQNNGCDAAPVTRPLYQGSISLTSWSHCRAGTEIALYRIKGWGHVWPGKYFTKELAAGNPLKDFDAAELIWQFFKRHRREP